MVKQIGKTMKRTVDNKKNRSMVLILLLCMIVVVSCSDDYIVGGEINETNIVNLNNMDYLKGQEETKVVADLFEKAGLKDIVNGKDVTIIAPSKWAVDRYLRRRHNQDLRVNPLAEPVTIDDISASDLMKMGMYVIPGNFSRETTPEEGLIVTAYNGTKVYISYDPVTTDPGSAWDVTYKYTDFMQKVPSVMHVHFKRGDNWEWTTTERSAMKDYFDNPECDHVYRVYMSDVITINGSVHIIYQGDYNYSDHYYYHSLFFFGTRKDDLL